MELLLVCLKCSPFGHEVNPKKLKKAGWGDSFREKLLFTTGI
jgi:hypothetical protein